MTTGIGAQVDQVDEINWVDFNDIVTQGDCLAHVLTGNSDDAVVHQVENLQRTVEQQRLQIAALQQALEGIVALQEQVAEQAATQQQVQADLAVMRMALAQAQGGAPAVAMVDYRATREKVCIPEPAMFKGAGSSKELDNFLWDMEQYFSANLVSDQERVRVCTAYLSDDAKFWWRTKVESTSEAASWTWEVFREELRQQFLPRNSADQARDAMNRLRQTDPIQEYVRAYSALMLEITDMSETDRRYTFLRNLQSWAEAEVRRHAPQDWRMAAMIAESLVDLRASDTTSSRALEKGAQIGQGGMTINQNMKNNLVSSGVSSGPGSMMPTPGISQRAGVHSLGMANNTAINMPLTQHPPNIQQSQSKFVKIWEGSLSGQRQGQPVYICKLEGYRNKSASDSLAADWPPTMHIVRLIAQEHMNNKQYVGKADFLVFRTLNQHEFNVQLLQLQEKKLCAVIQLPSQTLLLASVKAGKLIGKLFPGDMVVFKPQVPGQQPPQQQSQIQQLQQLQPQSQPHSHLQQQQQQQLQQPQLQQVQQHQHLQTQPLQLQQQSQSMQLQQQSQPMQLQQQSQPLQQQQQQMVNAGIGQTFIQGHGRSQMMTQAKLPQAGPTNITGGGFLS